MNLVLFALAEEVSPSFHWLDIRSPGESPAPFDPARLGWIDERRSWTLSPREALEPDNAQANAALFELVRGDEPPAMLARLSDFFRLPERMKEILAEIPSGRRPGVLAVANVQRAMHALPESALSPIVDALAWAGFSLLVGYVGPPPPIRARFTHALRIDGEGPSRWQDAQVVLEGNTPLRDLRPRTPTGLTELPFVSQVLQRALGDV